jgi:hypothetical protein
VTRREVPLDAAEIFRILERHGVEYVLIGGLAVQAHGHIRTTQDADVYPSATSSNLERLAAALEELSAHPPGRRETPAPNAVDLAATDRHVLDTVAGGLDVHLRPPGAKPWAEVRERALAIEVAGVGVAVAGRDDLIAMKRAAGRPVDRGDVVALTELDRA